MDEAEKSEYCEEENLSEKSNDSPTHIRSPDPIKFSFLRQSSEEIDEVPTNLFSFDGASSPQADQNIDETAAPPSDRDTSSPILEDDLETDLVASSVLDNSMAMTAESQCPQVILDECLKLFSTDDFILEPDVFATLSRYFQASGDPVTVINSLCQNYSALSQVCNILAEWLNLVGCDTGEVNGIFETHLQNLIVKYFDTKKADTIFSGQSHRVDSHIEWLPEVISLAPWRALIYQLSERQPDCLMLNFAIKLISDAGFQSEISRVTTATHQLDIFSRVLCTALGDALTHNPDSLRYQQAIDELSKIVGHGEHTYFYTQSILHCLSQEARGGGTWAVRVGQELRQAFRRRCLAEADDIALILHTSPAFAAVAPQSANDAADREKPLAAVSTCNPAVIQAMHSMLSRQSLNPADVSLLYNYYNGSDPPPVEIIRDTVFLDMLIDSLFRPKAKLNIDHKPKYLFLLSYAASVADSTKKGNQQRRQVNKEEIKTTQQIVEKAHNLLVECSSSGGDLPLSELQAIFQCLRYPAAAAGVLHWVKLTLTDSDYYKSHPEPMPVNLALLDEITSLHPLLHDRVFSLLVTLFELEHEGVDVLVQLERRRTLIDRLVHLLSAGYALPVTSFMRQKLQKNDADVSLIRYFVTETLEIIAPPYSSEFAENFLLLVENGDICRRETMTEEKWEAAKAFLAHCKP